MAQSKRPTAFLLVNRAKPTALAAYDDLRVWLQQRGQLAGASADCDLDALRSARPDRVIVLGGDGSILAAGRGALAAGVPIVGVNLGKLGYLAAYSVADLRDRFDAVMSDAALVSSRMTLDVAVTDPDGRTTRTPAINDCVIHAGPPYRMLTLDFAVDGQRLSSITGDGLIVSSPTGSTAHNMSAGGPILEPEVEAMVLTPLCPHSLAHRPVVMAATTRLTITIRQANDGSTAMIDGQHAFATPVGATITIQRGPSPFRLVRHPDRSAWQALVYKLKWGNAPQS